MAGLMGTGGTPSVVQVVGTLLSGVLGSGLVGWSQLASGAIVSGHIGSGAITGCLGGGALGIASGTIGPGEFGSGCVLSGAIASGQIGPCHFSSGSVFAESMASGSVLSGAIASGQIGPDHLSSGSVFSLSMASGSVLSGSIASGQVGSRALAGGTVVDYSRYIIPIFGGFQSVAPAIITGEIISGVKAVMVSQSGSLVVAMASVSGRMPAVGVVADNVASGVEAKVYTQGIIAPTSGLVQTVGFYGCPMWVGRTGNVTVMSGFFGSGGWASGDFGQRMGVAIPAGSGGILLNVDPTVYSGGPLGIAAGPAGVF